MKCFRSPLFRAGAIAVAVAALSAVPAPVFAYSGTTGLQPDLERAYTAASQEARAEGRTLFIMLAPIPKKPEEKGGSAPQAPAAEPEQ